MTDEFASVLRENPYALIRYLWPDVRLYDKQAEIIESVERNKETYVVAGNKLGKDFIAGLIALSFFMRFHPVRVLTSSVEGRHLDILWGEIDRFASSSKVDLRSRRSNFLKFLHMVVKKYSTPTHLDSVSYLKGIVFKDPEKMAGHHAPHTLFIGDESSGLKNDLYDKVVGWADKLLFIGNPNPCNNFFRKAVDDGDIPMDDQDDGEVRYFRKIIRIRAEDSPNVQRALHEMENGIKPSKDRVVPGILSYEEYKFRREFWSPVRQLIGLDAEFPEEGSLMFPPVWIQRCLEAGRERPRKRRAKGIGVDAGEGWANTTLTVVDEYGIIEQVSKKTPDTNEIPGLVIAKIKEHRINPNRVALDTGGGGKQHADRLRAKGFAVRTVPFGESVKKKDRIVKDTFNEKLEQKEEVYTYVSRRVQMYHSLSLLGYEGWGINDKYTKLIDQLRVVPLQYDSKGRMTLPDKSDMYDESPDEADSAVLGVYAMQNPDVGIPSMISPVY